MKMPPFFRSIRARLLLIALLLLSIPAIGFRFIQAMDGYLRDGQQQVLSSSAKLLSATLSDRPQLFQVAAGVNPAEETERRQLIALFSSADPVAAASLGNAYLPSEDIERILAVVASGSSRIWVVDKHSQVRGLAGSLGSPSSSPLASSEKSAAWGSAFFSAIVRPMIRAWSAVPAANHHEDPQTARMAVMQQVDRALVGEPTSRWRAAPGGPPVILSVAQPIWQRDEIVGAVVVEETTGGDQSLRSAALESLLATSLVVFAVGFGLLLAFAWRLAYRVRRLQREADGAIDVHGRIRGDIAGTAALDEIGALSRTLNATLQRLRRYNEYLERMAARLSHELRTPVAVVRSSLDNLRHNLRPEEQQVYISRADEGVSRLASLISRMSEATRLENMLQHAERENIPVVELVRGCVDGYRLAYPQHRFELEVVAAESLTITGNADAIAQMLDKLVDNAAGFAVASTPIRIGIRRSGAQVHLSIQNKGPLLPADAASVLFVSMVSARSDKPANAGHLGLGLYIVRMVAEFHGGTVTAGNLPDGSGVDFTVTLPC